MRMHTLDAAYMRVYTRNMERTFSCHCITLRYAAQTLTEVYDRVLAPSGLTVTQHLLLKNLLQEETEQSLTNLAHTLGSDRSTVGRNVRILARDGLVSLGRGSDRREHTVHITQKGRETVALAAPLWEKSQTAVEDTLGIEQLKTLRMLLSQLEEISI
ncbi:MarR family transcriptional regulator [Dictyobacter alpinus]|uniref:MarR family transcriptional regulator n=1 Tax=Dictyobacter alpinus TaxID=2014873 RepID=A0A402BE39_9CHLR|nr:MarR family winged helix-turn-helix transcriptional regulator [Dictyobacter alpinus]GCE29625.1 MarR family transcriptional regulator [Dictyobacter alpinus]